MSEMQISVTLGADDPGGFSFTVEVTPAAGVSSVFDVTLSREDYERLARPLDTPEQFVERCFEFLLEREPKESILRRFDVTAISRCFPEFEREIPRYLSQS